MNCGRWHGGAWTQAAAALTATSYSDGGLLPATEVLVRGARGQRRRGGSLVGLLVGDDACRIVGDLNADGDGCGGVGRAERDGDGRERERDHADVECGGRRKRL